jgi:hypothetical protein
MRTHSATVSATASAAALLLTILAAYEPPAHEPAAQERPSAQITMPVVKAYPVSAARLTRSWSQHAARTNHHPTMLVGISY